MTEAVLLEKELEICTFWGEENFVAYIVRGTPQVVRSLCIAPVFFGNRTRIPDPDKAPETVNRHASKV